MLQPISKTSESGNDPRKPKKDSWLRMAALRHAGSALRPGALSTVVGALIAGAGLLAVSPAPAHAWDPLGSRKTVTVSFLPSSTVKADGSSMVLVRVTVVDAFGVPESAEQIHLATNGDVTFLAPDGFTGPDGSYTTVITASTTADTETITATSCYYPSSVTVGPVQHVVFGTYCAQGSANLTETT